MAQSDMGSPKVIIELFVAFIVLENLCLIMINYTYHKINQRKFLNLLSYFQIQ
jgi:hypothetical protein